MKTLRVPNTKQAGQLLVLVLVFGAVFMIIITSFIGTVITQSRVVDFRYEQHQATEIAEAGLNYYKWYLAHFPGDTSGNGVTTVYNDPEAGSIGEYTLTINSVSYCGEVSTMEVISTAHTYQNPDAVSVVSATYKRPTVAEYSFINNAGVRYGASRVITGPVHGNQGVRMDGSHNSFVGAGVATYEGNGGVYTTTANATPSLFRYPISPIDFVGLTIDLAQMRTSAQNAGIYYGPSTGAGYRLVFNGDGTVDVFRVTSTISNYWSFSPAEGWNRDEANVINNTSQLADNLPINPDCPVLFFEDKLWLEGQVTQKVAVAAGLNTSNTQNNIVISNNVTYSAAGNSGLVAIAEDDVDIGLNVPDNMVANGIYIAQNGRFGRNHYCESDCQPSISGNQGLPGALDEFVSRNSLTRLGSVVSNLGGGTEWVSGTVHSSGFRNRITSFDRDQVDNPPPLTPTTNDVYELQDWRQEG